MLINKFTLFKNKKLPSYIFSLVVKNVQRNKISIALGKKLQIFVRFGNAGRLSKHNTQGVSHLKKPV